MNERCKHISKDGFRCGSYAFNLYKDDIEQDDLCDVHYWQTKAQPEQEPVKIVQYNCTCGRTMKFESVHGVVAPQRTWVGLTDEEIDYIYTGVRAVHHEIDSDVFARAIEAKLKDKNT